MGRATPSDHFTVAIPPDELDLQYAAAVAADFECTLTERVPNLVVDMRKVTFVDSVGLTALLAAHRRAQCVGGRVVLVGAGENVARLLQVTGLEEILPSYASIEAVREALGWTQVRS